MNIIKSLVEAVLVLTLMCSCITTSVTPLYKSNFAPRLVEEVQVYLSERDVDAPFKKVALIHASGDSGWTNQRMMIERAKKDAAKLGCNGLLLETVDEASQGAQVAAAIFGGTTQRHGKMVAILVEEAIPGQPPEQMRETPQASPATGPISKPRENSMVPAGSGPSFQEWLADKEKSDQR
ncbi:MAG: hypothetical protein JKY61_06405 [Planctomycetes bacterium]|nr:hypothetical protein [Planctomycetota bacterium]MBL4770764.1 hypothetical protein [Planctomycetota bacterium]